MWPKPELVHEEPIADEQRRLHAAARNAKGFGEQLARPEKNGKHGQDANDERASASDKGRTRSGRGTYGSACSFLPSRLSHCSDLRIAHQLERDGLRGIRCSE